MPKNTSKGYDDFLAAGGKDEWLDDYMMNLMIGGGLGTRSMGRMPVRGEIVQILRKEVRHVVDPIWVLTLDHGNYRYFNSYEEAKGARMLRGISDPWNVPTKTNGALFHG